MTEYKTVYVKIPGPIVGMPKFRSNDLQEIGMMILVDAYDIPMWQADPNYIWAEGDPLANIPDNWKTVDGYMPKYFIGTWPF